MHIIDDIPIQFNLEKVNKAAHVRPGSSYEKDLASLVAQVHSVARPKAFYKECYIEGRGEDWVQVDTVRFQSKVLRGNLAEVERVFAYVATCGTEVYELPLPPDDLLKGFWMDVLRGMLLEFCLEHLTKTLTDRFRLVKTAAMHPGSGDQSVWHIEQQRVLFDLLGDVQGAIGVRLTDSYLMVPAMSVSGVIFPTEKDFSTCQLCHRENCPSRSAPFDPILWEAYQLQN